MDTLQLKAFAAVAELQSFSLAAESLHLTQPAISKRIAGLEQHLGSKLLDRVGRQLRLTEAGKALLPRAHNILNELKDAQKAIKNLNGSVTGTLTLATSHHIGLHHLPAVLRRYTERYPEVQLQLKFLDSDTAYEAVHRGDVELALITLARSTPNTIQTTPLWPDPLAFVVATNHALANDKKIDLKALSQFPAILPEASTETTQKVTELIKQHHLTLSQSMPTNYLETIKMMVSIGLGWSVLPITMIDEQLHTLQFDNVKLERTLGCINHNARSLSNAAQAFLEALSE